MSILKVGMYASQRTAHGDKNYLTFSSDNPFSIRFAAKRWDGVLEYSLDAQHWYTWDGSTISSAGNVLYLRGLGNSVITNGTADRHAMTMTSPSSSGVSCTGNIMTLLDHESPGTAVMGARCFAWMFCGCTSLTTAPELPATTLANYCYAAMFQDTGIVTAPELPATTLADYCYATMFSGCTSLTTAPELPATTLADYCYATMFRYCANLTTAPDLPALTLADYCYATMFSGCTSLTTAPELPATTLADYCYTTMFRYCANLTTAPDLPALTLADYCYATMFWGCTSLTAAPELPATTLADRCYQNMFWGCTSLTAAPELPATASVYSCYSRMFYSCRNIRISSTQTGIYQKPWRIPTTGTGTTAAYWSTGMLEGTGGTFKSDPAINTTYYQAN